MFINLYTDEWTIIKSQRLPVTMAYGQLGGRIDRVVLCGIEWHYVTCGFGAPLQ